MSERYCRNPKVEEAPLGGDLMLFDPAKSKFFVLNPTMAYLWINCDGEKSLDWIVESIPTAFSAADAQIVKNDMRAAVEELVGLGMVTKG